MYKKYIGERHVRTVLLAVTVIVALLFSFYLMFHTFSYNPQKQELVIASKAWSDFGAHIPLIRSFSYGPNIARLFHGQPVESPLFPGVPIRYHYGFYALVGVLERLGLRIDWALNIPSALGFFFLLVCIYLFSYELFTSIPVSVLAVLFFLFNGSLTFLRFFALHPLSSHTLSDIITNSKFAAFGPWDGGDITAFWTLNIYTNQRHLALSYAIVLVVAYLALRGTKKTALQGCIGGILLGFLFFINYAAAGIAVLLLSWIFIVRKNSRALVLLIGLVSAVPFLLLTRTANIHSPIAYDPGYLVHTPKTVLAFLQFWFANIGLHLFLIPLGLLLAPKKIRLALLPPLLILFIIPNLYRFSPDMINNHKFFNFFLIIGNMFSAYALVKIMNGVARAGGKLATGPRSMTKIALAVVSMCLFMTLTLSGIIDFFPIINDYTGGIPDIGSDPDAIYILTHTKPTDVIANSTWFNHPSTLVGRSIFSGYTYFTWSYGYDERDREKQLIGIYRAQTHTELCNNLFRYSIAMVELNSQPETYLQPNLSLWNSEPPSYENEQSHRTLYMRRDLCPDTE